MAYHVATADHVAAGVAREAGNHLIVFDVDELAMPSLLAAIKKDWNYQDQIVLGPSRGYHPLDNGNPSTLLTNAGVDDGDGLAGNIGQSVPNPQSEEDAAQAALLVELQNRMIAQQLAAAQEGDPTVIPTPDAT